MRRFNRPTYRDPASIKAAADRAAGIVPTPVAYDASLDPKSPDYWLKPLEDEIWAQMDAEKALLAMPIAGHA
jgi:hypothetical protein